MKKPKTSIRDAKVEFKKYEGIRAALRSLKIGFLSEEIGVGPGHAEQISYVDALLGTVEDHLGSLEAHIDDLENE